MALRMFQESLVLCCLRSATDQSDSCTIGGGSAKTALGLGRVETALKEVGSGSQEPRVSQAAIAAISGLIPTMFMTRVRLYAGTERAISAATFGRVLVRKCVALIRAFIVPNGCSTVSRR